MAKLSAHGIELVRIERLDCAISYHSDGHILRNEGSGWKLWKKLRPGVDPTEAALKAKARYDEKLAKGPAFAAWRELVHDLCPRQWRSLLVTAVSTLQDDPDGLWSEMEMFHDVGLSLDDCVNLCRAYGAALLESNAARESQTMELV